MALFVNFYIRLIGIKETSLLWIYLQALAMLNYLLLSQCQWQVLSLSQLPRMFLSKIHEEDLQCLGK